MKSSKRVKQVKRKRLIFVLFALVFVSIITVFVSQNRQYQRTNAAPGASLLTDRTNLMFTANNYTSMYHLYAAGLDYSKPVGMLMFSDGSGESGISKPSSNYQMGGSTGLIAVAKKHNMILLTPFSPNRTCKCWDQGDREGYSKWAEALVTSVESQYQIDKRRVAVGGYSSGATLTALSWVPSGAAQRTMTSGVIVMISLGGKAYTKTAFTPDFKANIHMYWNIGDADSFLSQAQAGYMYYTGQGFQTAIDVLPGVTHSRGGEFGPIFDAQISKYISDTLPAISTTPSQTNPTLPAGGGDNPSDPTIIPTFVCGGSNMCPPSPTLLVESPSPTTPDTGSGDLSVAPTQDVTVTNPPSQISAKPIHNGTPVSPTPVPATNANQGLLTFLIQIIIQLLLVLFQR